MICSTSTYIQILSVCSVYTPNAGTSPLSQLGQICVQEEIILCEFFKHGLRHRYLRTLGFNGCDLNFAVYSVNCMLYSDLLNVQKKFTYMISGEKEFTEKT